MSRKEQWVTSRVRDEWLSDPPIMLAVGEGSYAAALAFVLGSVLIDASGPFTGSQENYEQPVPLVLRNLEQVILVAGAGNTASDLLRWHEAVWQWIEKLSPEGDEHDVAILFVLADASGSSLADGLAFGLGLEKIDPTTTGHGIARMSDSLDTLCTTLGAIRPMDLPPLRARRAANARHQALEELKDAASLNEPTALHASVEGVRIAFEGCEYHLDLFCQAPQHANGNRLRSLLQKIVTEEVTQYSQGGLAKEIASLLA